MEYLSKCNSNYSVDARFETVSKRIWVNDYSIGNHAALCDFLFDLARQKGAGKIVFPAREKDAGGLCRNGFRAEGAIPDYYRGTNTYFLAAYPSEERCSSKDMAAEQEQLKKIMSTPRVFNKKLPDGYKILEAGEKDILPMAELFREVFDSYPTPVYDPRYLNNSMKTGDIYFAAYYGRRLVSVASAEICPDQKRAELTNCATDPGFRGMSINSLLVKSVERKCRAGDISCLFSLSRASSYGMNLVFHRLGYVYGGTLINNCHIGGRFENMNIWVKPHNQ